MIEHAPSASGWRRLFRIACSLIDQANEERPVIDHWTLGGGTAMMLQINHRESDDIDIFLRDAQWLPLLNPDTHTFRFAVMPAGYSGDGSGFLKFAFAEGEIDFIVAPELTDNPVNRTQVEGVPTLLETVPEIITKKICFRGTNIQARDIFDIAAAGRVCGEEVARALARYPERVKTALAQMDKLNPEFVERTISQLRTLNGFKDMAGSSLDEARKLLRSVEQ